jgi:aminocarboxymuconate-semialdehyde decarboxylase
MAIQRRDFLGALAAAGGALLTGCAGTSPTRIARVIDAHSHWYPQEWVDLMQREGAANGAKISRNENGDVTFALPGLASAFPRVYIDLQSRIKAMDDARIDAQVLSLMQPMVYWAPPAFALQLSQVFNDACAAAHRQYPDRLVGLAMVPMQAPELAVRELERAGKLPGLRGLMMATAVNGRNLDDKAFFPIYAKCEELGWPIFPHPINPLGGDRMRDYNMRNLLGNPVEIGVAAAALIYGGVLDAFPKLDVMLPRAGGNLPFGIGRFDRNALVVPSLKDFPRPPSTYLRRFYCDTIIEHAGILIDLIRLMGPDRIVFGTDYASAMRDQKPVEFIEGLDLTASERALILGGNAARLFKL